MVSGGSERRMIKVYILHICIYTCAYIYIVVEKNFKSDFIIARSHLVYFKLVSKSQTCPRSQETSESRGSPESVKSWVSVYCHHGCHHDKDPGLRPMAD